jgi:hypothetical protein
VLALDLAVACWGPVDGRDADAPPPAFPEHLRGHEDRNGTSLTVARLEQRLASVGRVRGHADIEHARQRLLYLIGCRSRSSSQD